MPTPDSEHGQQIIGPRPATTVACRGCGEPIPDHVASCPECGYVAALPVDTTMKVPAASDAIGAESECVNCGKAVSQAAVLCQGCCKPPRIDMAKYDAMHRPHRGAWRVATWMFGVVFILAALAIAREALFALLTLIVAGIAILIVGTRL
jgi:hypothetical protein